VCVGREAAAKKSCGDGRGCMILCLVCECGLEIKWMVRRSSTEKSWKDSHNLVK